MTDSQRCPMCGKTDQTEALPAIYKASVPKLSFLLRPPTPPPPPILRSPVEVPPHPDDPQTPYQNRSPLLFALRGLLPFLLSLTACMTVWRLMNDVSIIYGDILNITILMFIIAPLCAIALFFTGRFVYRWGRYNVIDATRRERLQAHVDAVEENQRRAAENEHIKAAHADKQAEHAQLATYWQGLYYCHRDETVFDPATGEHHPRDDFREAMLSLQ